jgi:hypothetical protein
MIVTRQEAHAANPVFAYGEPWTEDTMSEVRALALQGLSRREVGLRIGRTADSVGKMGTALGIRFARDVYGGQRGPEQPFAEKRAEMVERDRRMIRALALAIYNGDHLPRASI